MPSDILFQVLCVDDDDEACEMLSLLLKLHQVEATCVRSAAEAWLKIKDQRFDLYMLDGWLPDVDGFEFCRQIRETDSSTPILFYSGAAYDADRARGMAAGASGYVVKPYVDRMIDLMMELLVNAVPQESAPLTESEPDSVFNWSLEPFFGLEVARG